MADGTTPAATFTPAFDQAFRCVLGEEGGFSDNPADPGNWTGGAVGSGERRGTKYGISAAAYPSLDIAALSLDQAKSLYRADYWTKAGCHFMRPSLALMVFDAAVNSGAARSVAWLQDALGVATDGQFGPHTLAALNAWGADVDALCADVLAARIGFLASLPTWRAFGVGWSRRLAHLPFLAMTMPQAMDGEPKPQ